MAIGTHCAIMPDGGPALLCIQKHPRHARSVCKCYTHQQTIHICPSIPGRHDSLRIVQAHPHGIDWCAGPEYYARHGRSCKQEHPDFHPPSTPRHAHFVGMCPRYRHGIVHMSLRSGNGVHLVIGYHARHDNRCRSGLLVPCLCRLGMHTILCLFIICGMAFLACLIIGKGKLALGLILHFQDADIPKYCYGRLHTRSQRKLCTE